MIVNGIDTKDISVVVQGAIDAKNTELCLKAIRKHLPGAEIILSTWEGSNVDGLIYDQLVLNTDPGATKNIKSGMPNNMNRLITSSYNGLLTSKKKYCLKLRSDLVLISHKFLKYANKFPKRDDKYTFFKNRMIFCSAYFKKYLGEVAYEVTPAPYHISDWLMFGLREDVTMLFDIDLAKEPENTSYLKDNDITTIKPIIFGSTERYSAEQYIFYQSLKKHYNGEIREFKNITDFCGDDMILSEKLVANNCIILEPYQFSVYCAKKDGIVPYYSWTTNFLSVHYALFEGLYRHDVFLDDYIKHCDSEFHIPKSVSLRLWIYLNFHKFFEKV